MPAERFFLDSPLAPNQIVEITAEEFAHLRVMRPQVGDAIELVNGQNTLAFANLTNIGKHSATAHIQRLERGAPLAPHLTLAIALPRFSCLEWAIEKGTELGANTFCLFPGDRSEKDTLSDQQQHRLRQLMIAALKQCGRLDLPAIELHPPLQKWHYPPQRSFQGDLFFGDLSSEAPTFASQMSKNSSITFFTGPGKGFSPEEVLILTKTWKARGVSLNPLILRAETAPIAVTALFRQLTIFL